MFDLFIAPDWGSPCNRIASGFLPDPSIDTSDLMTSLPMVNRVPRLGHHSVRARPKTLRAGWETFVCVRGKRRIDLQPIPDRNQSRQGPACRGSARPAICPGKSDTNPCRETRSSGTFRANARIGCGNQRRNTVSVLLSPGVPGDGPTRPNFPVSHNLPIRYPWGLAAGLAQLEEHLICNQRVGGSSPLAGTTVICQGRRWRKR